MNILIVKTSSMGDVLHTLPALTDASKHFPDIQFDWVLENGFAEIPTWHRQVSRVIPIRWRQWRKNLSRRDNRQAIKQSIAALREHDYDLIIDAQGLLKSSIIATLAKGKRVGLDFQSAREGLASLFYQEKVRVEYQQHAVTRMRELFAKALHYPIPDTTADYGIQTSKLTQSPIELTNYLVFLHGTTWTTKHYPEAYWCELAKLTQSETIVLPWGNEAEKQRAQRIAQHNPNALVLPKCNLSQIAAILANAKAVISVDTGLSHLSAALAKPTIALYGPTDPQHIGTTGQNQHHLAAQFECAPCGQRHCTYKGRSDITPACYTSINPQVILQRLNEITPPA